MAKANESRLAYADLLRVFAVLAVIVLHVAVGWLEALPAGSGDWLALNAWSSLTRWCVPIFVMCSGMFLLDPQKELPWKNLFFRYILRLVTALLFWGMTYVLLHAVLDNKPLGLYSLLDALRTVVWGNTEIHLWFLPMMVGLYLLTPILRAFVRGAKQSDFHWFFLLFFLFMSLVPAVLRLRGSHTVDLYATRMYLNFTLSSPPLAFVGYYLAGYYLKTYALNPLGAGLLCALGAGGAVATLWGTVLLNQGRGPGNFDSTLYSYLTPNVALFSVGVFVLFRYLAGRRGEARRGWVGRISGASFGIYLSHIIFLTLLRHFGLATPSIPAGLAVPLLTLVIFLPSFGLSWLVGRIPVVGRYLT